MNARIEESLPSGLMWHDREGRESFGPLDWGRDHLSMLLYIETRVVDGYGELSWDRLTLSARNWPMLYAARRNPYPDGPDAAEKYGLRMKGHTADDHCEMDAVMDLVMHDLVTVTMPPLSRDGSRYLKPSGYGIADPPPVPSPGVAVERRLMRWARFGLTDYGWTVSHALRRHFSVAHEVTSFKIPAR